MTIEKTVEITESRKLHLDVDLPETLSPGTANIVIIINDSVTESVPPPRLHLFSDNGTTPRRDWKNMCGMFKTDGHDVDRFIAQKHADKVLEYDIEANRNQV